MRKRLCIRLLFIFALMWATNGFAENEKSGLTIDAATNKMRFRVGETIRIEAKATYQNGQPVRKLEKRQIRIKDAKGKTRFKGKLSYHKSDDQAFEKEENQATGGLFRYNCKIPEKANRFYTFIMAHESKGWFAPF